MAGRIAAFTTGALLLLALAVTAGAQQVFRTSTDLVLLSVTATEAGRPARGLDRSDFQVFEDGRAQEITTFARDPQPVALSILIDTSPSMEPKIHIAQNAAVEFCRRLGPNDVAQIISFNSDTEIIQGFTGNIALLEKAIRSTRTTGSTALYTAMYIALDELRKVKPDPGAALRRQALVLLSDGEDTTSLLPLEDVLERAKRTDAIVFAIGFRSQPTPGNGFREYDYALRSTTQATGGRAYFVNTAAELPLIYQQIADELANQYTIGYTSRNTNRDGKWRQVSVRINRPGVVARTRAGYYAPTAKGQ